MQEQFSKSMTRRSRIGSKRTDRPSLLRDLHSQGVINSLWVAAGFFAVCSGILMLRLNVIPYRPGQNVQQDIHARLNFTFQDKDKLSAAKKEARDRQPRWYKPTANGWDELQNTLLALPKQLGDKILEQVPPDLQRNLELARQPGALTSFQQLAKDPRQSDLYDKEVRAFIKAAQGAVILKPEDYLQEMNTRLSWQVYLEEAGKASKDQVYPAASGEGEVADGYNQIKRFIGDRVKEAFPFSTVQANVERYILNTLQPNYVLDAAATEVVRREAADNPSLLEKASVAFSSGQPIVFHGTIGEHEWRILKAENKQYLSEMRQKVTPLIKWCLGLTGIVLTITVMMAAYIAMNQPRVVRNSARGLAIAVLLILMLLLAQLAAIGSGPLYMFGLAPTLLAAMILCIAYDRRFAMGIASMHGLLVAIALNQGTGFFAILWAGSFTCCCLLDSIRNRSKLIEVGGTTALAMIGVTIAAGAMSQESMLFVAENCLYAGAAAMAVGFVVLGILPFMEKLFKISTGMTLLELGDSGQPLLRRLALEAPGTYNHSMQVAVLAEAAGEAIGGNSLLCRVASYYHDVGKIIKPDYFVENQTGGPSKHLNLSPNVSLLIIISHVKDGMALAKEYNLPQQILPFIQQHHGTTLVEYFYYQACVQKDQQQPNEPQVSDTEFRYPGPKPKSKEIAIVMLADTVESAARAMREPTAGSIENLVHELTMKRLLDGQFHECDLTMSELDQVERALTKTLQSIYHGRIAYPVLGTTAKAPVQPPLVQTNTA